jgi:hypothetical protein
MLIKNKFNGYAKDGVRLYNFGGGGGGSTNTSYTSNIPEYAQPYVETMLGATQQQLFNTKDGQVTGFRPYAAYGAAVDDQGNILNTAQDQAKTAVAGFSPLQQQAQSGMANMRLPGQTEAASQMTADLAGRSLGAGSSSFNDPATSLGGQSTAASYMSPYMQSVVDIQKREAQTQADIASTQRGAQAVGAGAFGGSRHAIMDAEAARNLAIQKGDIQAQGSQAAYQQAQAQFNAEQQRKMLGVQQAGAMAGQLAGLGQQQYGQQMGLLGAQAQAGGQQQQLEQARINQAMQNYATQQQYPMMQLGLMSNMLRGLPMQSSTTSMYAAQPSALNQIAGSYGAYDQFNKAQNTLMGKAEGGVIKKMAAGGIASGVDPYELPGMSKRLSDQQLSQKMKDRETDPDTKGIMQGEIMRRKHVRGGMANGGVIAFEEGSKGAVKEKGATLHEKQIYDELGIDPVIETSDQRAASAAANRRAYIERQNLETKLKAAEKEGLYERGDAKAAAAAKVKSLQDQLTSSGKPPAVTTAAPVAADARPNDGKYVDVAKPVPKDKKVITNAAPAARSSDTGAPRLGGDSEETLYRKYIENAGKPSDAVTKGLTELEDRAKMTPAQHYAEVEGFRKQMGVDTGAMLESQRATQRGMSEDVEKRGKYAAYMRNSQLFAKIAMTPGPILSAAAKAMNDVIPEMIEDGEKQEKAQNEIKKALAALDMSEYLDKAGKADKALEARNTANVALMTANMEIDKAKRDSQEKAMTSVGQVVASKRSDESRERSASMRGAGGAGGEGKLDMAQNKAGDAEMARFEKSWAKRLENMERYALAPKGSTAKKQSDEMREQYEKERAAKEAQIAAQYPSKFRRGAPAADDASTEADIAYTAKKHNMTVEQVKAELERLARNK